MMNNPDPNTVKSEQETRQDMINQALRFYGPEAARQVRLHFQKYDNLLIKVTNDSERKHIKRLAIAELYKMMGFYQGLTVNQELIIPPEISEDKKE